MIVYKGFEVPERPDEAVIDAPPHLQEKNCRVLRIKSTNPDLRGPSIIIDAEELRQDLDRLSPSLIAIIKDCIDDDLGESIA